MTDSAFDERCDAVGPFVAPAAPSPREPIPPEKPIMCPVKATNVFPSQFCGRRRCQSPNVPSHVTFQNFLNWHVFFPFTISNFCNFKFKVQTHKKRHKKPHTLWVKRRRKKKEMSWPHVPLPLCSTEPRNEMFAEEFQLRKRTGSADHCCHIALHSKKKKNELALKEKAGCTSCSPELFALKKKKKVFTVEFVTTIRQKRQNGFPPNVMEKVEQWSTKKPLK